MCSYLSFYNCVSEIKLKYAILSELFYNASDIYMLDVEKLIRTTGSFVLCEVDVSDIFTPHAQREWVK